MKIKALIAASALILGGGSAMAACTSATVGLGNITNSTAFISNSFASPCGTFNDTYNFSVDNAAVGGQVVALNFFTNFISGLNGSITGGSLGSPLLVDLVGGFTTFLAGGSYALHVAGTVTGASGGAYTGGLVASVPEPEAALLALACLGTIGGLARRAHKAKSTEATALLPATA